MTLDRLNNNQLEDGFGELVKRERQITREVVEYIREIVRRRIFLDRGFPSVYAYLIEKYGYSRTAAARRISAAKMLHAVPEVKDKISDGQVNLSTLNQLSRVIQQNEKKTGQKMSAAAKRDLLTKIEGKTCEQTERILAELFPEAQPKRGSLKAINASESRLNIVLSKQATEDLKRIRELLSHSHHDASIGELVERALREFVLKHDPIEIEKRCQKRKARKASARIHVVKLEDEALDSKNQIPLDEMVMNVSATKISDSEFTALPDGLRDESLKGFSLTAQAQTNRPSTMQNARADLRCTTAEFNRSDFCNHQFDDNTFSNLNTATSADIGRKHSDTSTLR